MAPSPVVSPLVLIVEDEAKIAALLTDYLTSAGFVTQTLDNGLAVAHWLESHHPDMIILDLMLPGKDGLDVCRDIRRASTIPILMLTARVDETDRLLGLELGADDYLCKPFSTREVVARVRAILRRSLVLQPGIETCHRGLRIDRERYEASITGERLALTPIEFRILARLVEQPGRVYSRDQLREKMYGDNRVVSDRTVDSHVKNLRRKLQPAFPGQDVIQSVYAVGYRFE